MELRGFISETGLDGFNSLNGAININKRNAVNFERSGFNSLNGAINIFKKL